MSLPKSVRPTRPYKGVGASYQAHDREFFFGREAEANVLVSKIESSMLALLYAQSGAGKTSLLNAQVIPSLESSGWLPVRARPQLDPVDSVRRAALQYLMPPPETEVFAIDRIAENLGDSVGNLPDEAEVAGLSLRAVRDRYRALAKDDPRRRNLIAPVEGTEEGGCSIPSGTAFHLGSPVEGDWTPFVVRFLRGTIGLARLAEHLEMIAENDSEPLAPEGGRLQDLRARLVSVAHQRAYAALLNELTPPLHGLDAFFENLFEIVRARGLTLKIMLILDQFEELFTRFIDSRPRPAAGHEDWRLKWQLFLELERLYRRAQGEGGARRLPVRVVLSMRSEYIADLDPIREFVPDLDASSYHLRLLGTHAARAAVERPARAYRLEYPEDMVVDVLETLAKEERYVIPSYLQIVCDKLWDVHEDPDTDLESWFHDNGRSKGILDRFFDEFLNDFVVESERLESLELLEPLITGAGTRRIEEESALVSVPFRFPKRRARLLERLRERSIVRIQARYPSAFVEISHEFLIDPVKAAIRDQLYGHPAYSQFLVALQLMRQRRDLGQMEPLPLEQFKALHDHLDEVNWDEWSAEFMLWNEVHHLHHDAGEAERLAVWLERFSDLQQAPAEEVLETAFAHGSLTPGQLAVVNSQRSSLVDLDSERLAFVLRAQLLLADDGGHDDVRYWTKRFVRDGR